MVYYNQSTTSSQQALDAFTWTDVFIKMVNDNLDQPILHIWPMEQTVILGMLDRQVPDIQSGLDAINRRSYRPVLRHIGGLAVVADAGILNFSFILPDTEREIGIKEAYLLMVNFIRLLLSDFPLQVEAFEIKNSYCPGNYDLSIGGKKFAGIAQRRVKDAIVVSIYMSISGNQADRGELIKEFYEKGRAKEQERIAYPDIIPSCMATLSDLCGLDLSVADMIDQIYYCLSERLSVSFKCFEASETQQSLFKKYHEQTYQRQQLLQEKEGF